MAKFYNISNHSLTQAQIESLAGWDIVELPPELKQQWGQVSPEGEGDKAAAEAVLDWLLNVQDVFVPDVCFVSGELGSTYRLVSSLRHEGIRCVYATTRRESVEVHNPDGSVSKQNTFTHVMWREFKEGVVE